MAQTDCGIFHIPSCEVLDSLVVLPPSQILTFYIAHLLIQSTVKLCNCGAGQGKEGQEKASNERAGLVPMQFTVIQCSTWSRRAGRIQIDTNQRHDTGMLTAVEVCEQVGLVSSLHVPGLGEPQLKDPHRSRNRSLVDADQRVIRS
ncbi:unnamed protein product [Fusarium graminearum]|nr:unnamed protein product [Fusarium graminearum]CAG1964761.1 unnamed protein product [Fusarium graminearum]